MKTIEELMKIPTWVFDLEGTLLENKPYQEVLEEVAAVLAVPYAVLYESYKNEWHGLGHALSMHLAMADHLPNKNEARHTIEAAYRLFSHMKNHPEVSQTAADLLRYMYLNGRRLICWTRGDAELQRQVIKAAGFDEVFDEIIVTPVKNATSVRERLLPVIGDEPYVMVGDSYEDDLMPCADSAEGLVWITECRAAKYRAMPEKIRDDVIRMPSVDDLYVIFFENC